MLLKVLAARVDSSGELRRGSVRLADVCASVDVLCDPRLPDQWLQGLLTCYMATCWLLRTSSLPLGWLPSGTGPALETDSDDGPVMVMSMAGAGTRAIYPLHCIVVLQQQLSASSFGPLHAQLTVAPPRAVRRRPVGTHLRNTARPTQAVRAHAGVSVPLARACAADTHR